MNENEKKWGKMIEMFTNKNWTPFGTYFSIFFRTVVTTYNSYLNTIYQIIIEIEIEIEELNRRNHIQISKNGCRTQ